MKPFLCLFALISAFFFSCKKDAETTTTADFTYTVQDLKVNLFNRSQNASSYVWNFGDGSPTSATTSPVYTYPADGTYTVTLTAKGGNSVTVSKSITVKGTGPLDTTGVQYWITTGDQAQLLKHQNAGLTFTSATNTNPTITLDTTVTYQTVEGFGYSLTGGSAQVINAMSPGPKAALLQELFGSAGNSIGISYLRISIGASDLNSDPFTYDDIPAGQTDPSLTGFSMSRDLSGGTGLIPLLKEIIAINPNIRIMGSPWTSPAWMKTNSAFSGGSLKPEHYATYAQYFVKYIQQMKAQGITIDAITPQNEPENDNNNPSMAMTSSQQRDFIKNNLGPAFQAAAINTKIILFDHNCNNPSYPISIMNDATAKSFVEGSAFHLYTGNISALTTVHNAHPDKGVYFTEQWTSSTSSFANDLNWNVVNVVIGSMRNWSRVALQWNLANDASYGPFTSGGCSQCKGALTISGSDITRNSAYYIIGHAAKFVPAGSVRIATNQPTDLSNVAFRTPNGRKVVVMVNTGTTEKLFNIDFKGKIVSASLLGGAAATFVWR